MEALDALVLPAMFLTIVVVIGYVWTSWLGKKENRALNISTDSEDENDGAPLEREPPR